MGPTDSGDGQSAATGRVGRQGCFRDSPLRQLLVESTLLASIAGLVGVGLSVVALRWLVRVMQDLGAPYGLPFEMTMDGVVFAFVAVLCVVVVAFGLAPALLVSRADMNATLKDGGRDGVGGVRARRWTNVLVVGELALTLTLLAGAGFMVRSFVAQFWVDLGLDPSPLLTMRISMVQPKYAERQTRAEVFRQLEARLVGIASIEAAAMATSAPFQFGESRLLVVEARSGPAGEARPTITRLLVGDAYFDTVGVPLVRGRTFTPSDGLPGQETAIVNRRFAAMHFGGEDPIGRRIKLDAPSRPGSRALSGADEANVPWLTIVGLAPDIRQEEESPAQLPLVYLPYRTEYLRSGDLIVRTRAGNPAELAPLVQEALREIDPDLAFFNIQTLEQLLAWRRSERRLFVSVLATFALFALFLSALGLYAVTAYSVTQRTREIGLRVALGARPAQVQRLVLGLAFRQLAIGLSIGVAGALGIGQVMRGLLFGTSPTDPTTFMAIVAILTAVALAASWLPARRAVRVDPMVALRSE